MVTLRSPPLSQAIKSLACVLKHKLEEIDREISRTESGVEWSYLWRVRSSLSKLWTALIGHEVKK